MSPYNIWEQDTLVKAGVVNITTEYYENFIYSQKIPSDWFIAIVKPGNYKTSRKDYSVIAMKSLLYLKQEYPEMNVGFI